MMALERPKGSLISFFSRMVARHGGIDLAQGKPGFAPPQELLDILKEKIADKSLHQYAPGIGNFELLDLLAQKYSEIAPVDVDNILIVLGATEGIFLTFLYLTRILEKPYSALSFDPVYESYPKLPEIFQIPFEYFDLAEDLSIDFDKLEKVIKEKRVKILFIASPGNPLGKVWTRQEIESAVFLSRRYQFYIIYDAVYKDIYFDQRPFNPLSLHHEKLFYIDSFSKMLSITGWRIGYIIAAKEHMARIQDIHDYTGLSAASILQAAVVEYLKKYNFGTDYLESVREKCKDSYSFLKRIMGELGFTVPQIQGGYFLWAKLPPGYQDAFRFALDLYHKVKLGVVPGENFSLKKKHYIRLNITQEMTVIDQAAQRIKRFCTSNRQQPLETGCC